MATSETVKDQVGQVLLKTIEQIDDYFEYRCRSEEDQAFVHAVLGKRETKLQAIRKEAEETKAT